MAKNRPDFGAATLSSIKNNGATAFTEKKEPEVPAQESKPETKEVKKKPSAGKSDKKKTEKIEEKSSEQVIEPTDNRESTTPEPAKRAKGRPKGKVQKKPFTIYLPVDFDDGLNQCLAVKNKTLSEYVEQLISEDLEKKGATYKRYYEELQNI